MGLALEADASPGAQISVESPLGAASRTGSEKRRGAAPERRLGSATRSRPNRCRGPASRWPLRRVVRVEARSLPGTDGGGCRGLEPQTDRRLSVIFGSL
jgi:hypothetical protein